MEKLIQTRGKKVDHTSESTKDVADAVANCVFYLSGEWEKKNKVKDTRATAFNILRGFK